MYKARKKQLIKLHQTKEEEKKKKNKTILHRNYNGH